MKNKIILATVVLMLAISIPLTMFLLQQRQDQRSKAAASTTLSFNPSSQITASPSADIYLDIMIDPGTNALTYVRYHVTYDPAVVQLAATPFVANTTSFPVNLEGPYMTTGSIIQSLSIGSDPTKVVTKPTKVGTLHFKAINPTNDTPTKISFGDKTYVLSSAENDQASENVLQNAVPVEVVIADASASPSPSLSPTVTETPSQSPTEVPTATPTPALVTETPTSSPTAVPTVEPTSILTMIPTAQLTISPTTVPTTHVSLDVFMHGIGASGDNVNPSASDYSNKDPLHPTRSIDISLFNESNILTATVTGEIKYSSESGNFLGIVGLPSTIPNGIYTIKVKTSQHLVRRIPGIITIQAGQTTALSSVTMITGDANNDNRLSILDYNLLIGCFSDLTAAIDCNDQKKVQTDLNDDDKVNSTDYNLFLRELGSQRGD